MNDRQSADEAQGFRALRQNPHSLQLLLDSIACGILTIDRKGCIAYTNNSARRLLGKSREELVDRHFADLDWVDGRGLPVAPANHPFTAALERGETSQGKIFSVASEDSRARVYFIVNVVPLHSRSGRITGAAADFIDISEQTRFQQEREQLLEALRQSEACFRVLAEAAPVGVFKCDGRGRWQYVNPRWAAISGLTTQESLGLGWARKIHPEDRERIMADLQEPEPGIWEREFRLLHPGGRLVWVRLLRRAESVEGNHFVGTLEDITDHKETELALQQAKEAAEEVSQAKSRFLSVMSHEIRTPMTIFSGMVELALAGELSNESRHFLESAESAADSLLMLIEDVLLYAELETGRATLERFDFDLASCVREALRPAAVNAAQKGLEFRLELAEAIPETLNGDPRRLRQVLANMADNAVRFTECGEVRVRVETCSECLNEKQEGLRISVSDTGCGIPEDKIGRIFKAFGQLDASSTRRHGGTGLGLAISRGIIASMGGEVQVESAVGSGSIFSFVIPLGPDAGPLP